MDMKWIAYVHDIAWTAADGTPLGGFAYTYDVVGRITARRHALGTNRFDRAYAYDDLDRLAADGPVSYAYDAAGNRTAKTGDVEGAVAYTRGVGDRLASWTGGAYTYDAAGNVTRIVRDGRPTLDLSWNGRYQLVSVSTNGVFAEGYAYDALGRRASTTTWEGTVRHVYDDNWQVIADLDSNGNVLRSYVWGEGIDRLLAVKVGTKSYAALTDVQGTVWGLADGTDVVARWTYDAWGNVLSGEASDPALAAFRYRFQGREFSAVTGLTNFRMRWYDPRTGRWLSKDPIRLLGGLNLYAFCGDDPLNKTDWRGLSSNDDSSDGEESFWDKLVNWIKAYVTASQASLPVVSSTLANALDGAATGAALSNGIRALTETIDAIDSGALEANDKGGILQSNESIIRRSGQAADAAMTP